MKTVALIQARLDSSRLPGKVLKKIGSRPALEWIVRAARAIPGVDEVVVATSQETSEDPIVQWCESEHVSCFRGDKENVLKRLSDAAAAHKADIVIRLTADCPFLDSAVCGQVLYLLVSQDLDFASNAHPSTWPDGLDCEVMRIEALETAVSRAVLPSDLEHVTPFIRARKHDFKTAILTCPVPGLGGERWTLDNQEDFDFLDAVARYLPAGQAPDYIRILQILDQHKDLRAINTHLVRAKEKTKNLLPDLKTPDFGKHLYQKSSLSLERAEKTIPLGTQTFSKSRMIFPQGKAPLFLGHGLGGRVWDIDGNAYVDHICGLLPNVLGYCDPDVDEAIRLQLTRGISFSLSTELEIELAETLVDIIPCAEKVRFGKNGTDATSAAVRLARAFTGRDRIAVCGYHGWQDWYIGSTTRDKGVPGAVRGLTHKFGYNNLESLEQELSGHKDQFAAVILEPATFSEPEKGFLQGVVDLSHRHGALVIFDEVVTGFRFAMGGAQELFGVTPDLAAFGKAMGNGMPISAVMGRADIMDEMEHVFYSGTFGGETLSLAASLATIRKMERENVVEGLWEYGQSLADSVNSLIEENNLSYILNVQGFAPWMQLAILESDSLKNRQIRTYLMRQLMDHGVLMISTHNICHAHNHTTLTLTLAAYQKILPVLADVLQSGHITKVLDCPVIEPVFKVRSET